MSDLTQWLEKNGPATKNATALTWVPGPKDPESGIPSSYVIEGMDCSTHPMAPENHSGELLLLFQNGVVPENGLNGVTPEVLLEILIDRFNGYQAGPLACEENDAALTGMRDALEAIRLRRANRRERGVLNTLAK